MALNGLLGLVCDPVAGLVEIPCVQRNVTGALNALGCADMALAGVVCRIPADEAIDAMGDIGDKMPSELRETGRGGLAATPDGKAIAEKLLSPLSEDSGCGIFVRILILRKGVGGNSDLRDSFFADHAAAAEIRGQKIKAIDHEDKRSGCEHVW